MTNETDNDEKTTDQPLKLSALLCVLNTEIRGIFDHDELFLDEFARGEYNDLIEVSFTSHHLKIVYVLECGQNVADTISMDEYMVWRDKYLDT